MTDHASIFSAQDMASRTIGKVLRDVSEATGYTITVLMGGPEPASGGEVTSLEIAYSGSPDIPSFHEWMDLHAKSPSETFESRVKGPFKEYIASVFRESVHCPTQCTHTDHP